MGPSLRLSELEAWCRSRGVSEADESQLRAVFEERDRFERDLLNVHDALHRECDGTTDLPAEIRRLRASNEGIAASLEAQVEAARKDEREACAQTLERLPECADVRRYGAAAIRARGGK